MRWGVSFSQWEEASAQHSQAPIGRCCVSPVRDVQCRRLIYENVTLGPWRTAAHTLPAGGLALGGGQECRQDPEF